MTLAWVWLAYPSAAVAFMRVSDSRLPMATLVCMMAVFVPYTFLQPWGHPPQLVPGSNARATAFNLLYEVSAVEGETGRQTLCASESFVYLYAGAQGVASLRD